MEDEGLFRRSPSSVMLRAAQDAYDRGNVVSLATFGDPNLAAVLIKKYLRDLPDPIFPESSYLIIRQCPMPSRDGDTEAELATVHYVREALLPELVPCALVLLSYVLRKRVDGLILS
jgi:Rho GTPase-activating protein 1